MFLTKMRSLCNRKAVSLPVTAFLESLCGFPIDIYPVRVYNDNTPSGYVRRMRRCLIKKYADAVGKQQLAQMKNAKS